MIFRNGTFRPRPDSAKAAGPCRVLEEGHFRLRGEPPQRPRVSGRNSLLARVTGAEVEGGWMPERGQGARPPIGHTRFGPYLYR